jgi:hypothetical protein
VRMSTGGLPLTRGAGADSVSSNSALFLLLIIVFAAFPLASCRSDCSSLVREYSDALSEAQICDPHVQDPCGAGALSSLDPNTLCCNTFANPTRTAALDALIQRSKNEGCAQPGCAPCAPNLLTCQANTSGIYRCMHPDAGQ